METNNRWEPVLETGKRVSGFLRHVPTGNIYYRESFPRLGIKDLFAFTGEKNLQKAKKQAKVLVKDHLEKYRLAVRESQNSISLGKTFGEIVDEVLELRTPKVRLTTQAQHKSILSRLKIEFGHYPANEITPVILDTFIERERQSNRKRWKGSKRRETFGDYAKLMSLSMRWAYQNRYVTHLVKFNNPDKGRSTQSRVYTDDEIQSLWENMNEDMRDQFILAYQCFMRLREMIKVPWERVNLETGVITLRKEDVKTGSKTGKGRQFIMSPDALARLRARKVRTAFIESPYVFPARGQRDRKWNPSKPQLDNKTAWKFAKRKAKIVGRARWHGIRHTALTKALIEKKVNPLLVSEYAGVSLATIQKVYLHSRAEHTKEVSYALSIPFNK